MATRPKSNLTVEQYLEAYQGAPGRYELVDGEVVKMAADTVLHVRLKGRGFAGVNLKPAHFPRGCFEVYPADGGA